MPFCSETPTPRDRSKMVEIVPTQVGIAVGGFDFEGHLADIEYGNIESTPPRSKTASSHFFLVEP